MCIWRLSLRAQRWLLCLCVTILSFSDGAAGDHLRVIQEKAFEDRVANWGYWGTNPEKFITWKNHSNRLVPVYTFGITLDGFAGKESVYRVKAALKKLYGRIPDETLNPQADYLDQTDIWHLQKKAVEELKKRYLFLIIFDGMDWETTRVASIARLGHVAYDSGRGRGLSFQDYRGAPTDFGFMATSPHNSGTKVDVNQQRVRNPGGSVQGGYSAIRGGETPWSESVSHEYLICQQSPLQHAIPDSAATGTSMCSGIKTFNGSINVSADGSQVEPLARWLQANRDYAIGVVTSVPVSHATTAASYANNVQRSDYQDLSRDLLGLPSIAHPEPLPGVDVLLGCGWGEEDVVDAAQGDNFVAGNRYVTDKDLTGIDVDHGGSYVVAQCTPGRPGAQVLQRATERAIKERGRLFGFFGCEGHLPFQTADGKYDPVIERYPPQTVVENPKLAEMTSAAIRVLHSRSDRFWLMIEAGDVDWANHANNLDDSAGAVFSGDDAFRAVTDWIEQQDAWDDAAVIVTADHGHYFVLTDPQALLPGNKVSGEVSGEASGDLPGAANGQEVGADAASADVD
jgi:alkaline phosphatase